MKNFMLSIILLFGAHLCQAELVEVRTMKELQSHFLDADPSTLVIFDVDMVLVQPDNPAFQMANMKRFGPSARRIMSELSKDKQMVFLALMTVSSKTILIDQEMPALFQKLALQKVPTMALTSNLTGEFAGIKNMEQWRFTTLKDLGIDFSTASPCKMAFRFTELASYRGNYTTYIDGMMFVNGRDVAKGDAFIAFLDKAKISPSKIIFVDDREENVKSLEEAAKKLGIAYTGIHFLGAQQYPSEQISEAQFESEWNTLAAAAQKM